MCRLCGPLLLRALDVINGDSLLEVKAECGRSYHQVTGSGSYPYLVVGQHCTCKYFLDNVIQRQRDFTCKHVLAIQLADAINYTLSIKRISDDEFGYMLEKLILHAD